MENMEKELEERELKELELMNENENREFYVYVHIRKDNNTVFYVGKGTKNRAYDLDRSNFHNGVCKEYGCRVEIIKDNLTESQAFRLESKMIKYYVLTLGYGAPIDGYRDFSNNYLTNFTWGGEGASGYKFSEEQKQNLSESLKGRQLSEEHKQNLSESMKGKNAGQIPWNKGKETPEETKQKISESEKGKSKNAGEKNPMWGKQSPNRRKVMCITTGETLDSIKEAAKKYNIYCTSISKCCNGKQKSAGELNGVRLQWKYVEDDDNESKAI